MPPTLNRPLRDDPCPDDWLCEACGYALRGLRLNQDCPECGQSIDASHPKHRPGLPWQQAMTWGNFWRTWWMVVRRPGESFRRMRLGSGTSLAGRGRAFEGVSILLASFVFITLGGLLERYLGPPVFGLNGEVLLNLLLAMFALWSLTVIETWGVKLFSRRRSWPGAAKWARHVTSYASAGWIVAGAVWGIGLFGVDWITTPTARPLRGWGGTTFLNYPLDWYLNALVFFLGLLCFEILVYIGVRQIRYANSTFPKLPKFPESPDSLSAGTDFVESAQSQDRGT